MTTRLPHHDAFEREWRLQERARLVEREGDDAGHEPQLAEYRRIVRALRTPPAMRLPSNFAYHVAQLAARLPRHAALDLRLERWLLRGLVAAMALGAIVASVLYGRDWLAAFDARAGGATGGWIVAAAGCLLATWAVDGLRHWRSARSDM